MLDPVECGEGGRRERKGSIGSARSRQKGSKETMEELEQRISAKANQVKQYSNREWGNTPY